MRARFDRVAAGTSRRSSGSASSRIKASRRKTTSRVVGVPNPNAWLWAGTEPELPPRPSARMEPPRVRAPRGDQPLAAMPEAGAWLAESPEEFWALYAAELLPCEAIERLIIRG